MFESHLLTNYDAAERLGISVRKLNRLVRNRLIPFIELPDGDIRFSFADLSRWIKTRNIQTSDQDSRAPVAVTPC